MPHPKVKISDNSGNTVAVDTSGASNALNVKLIDSNNAIETLLDQIDSDTSNLSGCVGTDGSTGPSKVLSIGGTVAVGGAIQEIMVDSLGHLQVDVLTTPSTAVTNAGTFVTQIDGDALTALQLIDDAVHQDDAGFTLGTHKGVMMMGFAGVQSVDANDAAALRCTTTGMLSVNISGADGLSTYLPVSSTGSNFPVQISDTSFAVADGNALGEGVLVQGDDGSDRKNIHVDASTGDVQVDVTNTVTVGSHAVTNAGTFAVQSTLQAGSAAIGKLAANSGVDIGDVDITSIAAGDNNIGNVDIASALPAGSNAIGKLAANSGVDIGDVTINNIGDWLMVNRGVSGSPVSQPTITYSGLDALMIAGVVCKDVLAAHSGVTNNEYTTFQVDTKGALYTTHGITGGADGVTVVSTAGTDVVLGGDVACKKIDIQAQTDNTGVIAVGFTGVDATIATGTGVILYPGDTYSLEINNLNLIYIDSAEDGEGVRYTYFT